MFDFLTFQTVVISSNQSAPLHLNGILIWLLAKRSSVCHTAANGHNSALSSRHITHTLQTNHMMQRLVYEARRKCFEILEMQLVE